MYVESMHEDSQVEFHLLLYRSSKTPGIDFCMILVEVKVVFALKTPRMINKMIYNILCLRYCIR